MEPTPSRVATTTHKPRPCTAAEIADQKAAYEKEARENENTAEMAKIFGLPGLDDESNRAFAAKLSKYAGWRSVTYRGHGVFDVNYHFEGRATQDFLFPALPDDNLSFLSLPPPSRRRLGAGDRARASPADRARWRRMAGAGDMGKAGPVSRAQGRFTIITDGEILTNNSEDGPVPNPTGRQLHWDVVSASTKIPEALIRL